MTKAIWFWLLMAIWLLFGIWSHWGGPVSPVIGGELLLFILLGLLGWHSFGSPVQ